MINIVCLTVAYLLGSIPFGLIIGRLAKGIDIREHGSKNIGATNVFRTVGKKWGILVLALDAMKGAVACFFPVLFGAEDLTVLFRLLLGVTAILGHSFPVWIKFKGGKGVATSLGVFLAVCWKPTLITFGIWILVLLLTHIISVSSLVAAVVFPLMVTLFYFRSPDFNFLLPVSLLLVALIFYTHRANLKRLREGTEKRIF